MPSSIIALPFFLQMIQLTRISKDASTKKKQIRSIHQYKINDLFTFFSGIHLPSVALWLPAHDGCECRFGYQCGSVYPCPTSSRLLVDDLLVKLRVFVKSLSCNRMSNRSLIRSNNEYRALKLPNLFNIIKMNIGMAHV
jgi:hypothetical protein